MSASALFVDSGAFIALSVANDTHHQPAVDFYHKSASRPKVTTNLVIAETYTWLRYKVGYEAASTFAVGANAAEERGFLTVIRSSKELENETLLVLQRYTTEALSFVDGLSFVVIQNMNIKEVFGFDRHFYVIGCHLVPNT